MEIYKLWIYLKLNLIIMYRMIFTSAEINLKILISHFQYENIKYLGIVSMKEIYKFVIHFHSKINSKRIYIYTEI